MGKNGTRGTGEKCRWVVWGVCVGVVKWGKEESPPGGNYMSHKARCVCVWGWVRAGNNEGRVRARGGREQRQGGRG